jgi:erythromycin esterase-like protein
LGGAADYDPLVAAAVASRFVLLGESTHGTHEFYRERARISERLIREAGFGAVALEADWPDTERVNRYVRGLGDDRTAEQALGDYKRFPRWMWRNAEFRDFVERLRAHNATLPPERRVGVYGMDVYNLWEASDAVLAYLRRTDPAAATRVAEQYRCFARHRPDIEAYGRAAAGARSRSCQTQATAVLEQMRALPRPSDPTAAEALFSAQRSAASVAGAEEYYRVSFSGGNSWNRRDRRMADTVTAISDHVGAVSGREGKVVVWGHNTHAGDARATQMKERGELNLGELMRTQHPGEALLVGFLTHGGIVMAAPEWGRPGRVYTLRPALEESYAGLFHRTRLPAFVLMLRGSALGQALPARLERAVGVIYAPDMEREAHYFEARLAEQFDAVVYVDRTQAVTPLK